MSIDDGGRDSTGVLPPGGGWLTERLAKWRLRAEHAAQRYQSRAQRHPLLGFPLAFIARYTARQGVLLASAVAFRLFLWLLPLALLAAGILAAVAPGREAGLESASKLAGVTGVASEHLVTALYDAHRSWWVAVLLGAVFFLWASRKLVRNLTVVTAHVWGVPVPRRRQKDALVTSVIIAGDWILLVTATTFLWRLRDLRLGVAIAVFAQTVALAGCWLLISRRLPARTHATVDLAPGCLVFGLGLAVLNAVSRIYLPGRLDYSSDLYGPLGVAAVILGWLLITAHLIVSSAVINAVWFDHRLQRRAPSAAAGRPSVRSDSQ